MKNKKGNRNLSQTFHCVRDNVESFLMPNLQSVSDTWVSRFAPLILVQTHLNKMELLNQETSARPGSSTVSFFILGLAHPKYLAKRLPHTSMPLSRHTIAEQWDEQKPDLVKLQVWGFIHGLATT